MEKEKSLADPLNLLDHPELIIGLVGPIGADLSTVYSLFQDSLRTVGYKTIEIKLSSGLPEIGGLDVGLKMQPEDEYIETHMNAGTALRNKLGRGDVLALMALGQIRQKRYEITGDVNKPAPRTAYILRSFKHRDEVESMRRIYGRLFYVVSVYLPRQQRIQNLAKRIAKSHHDSNADRHLAEAVRLVQKDQLEDGKQYGQDVGRAFPLADLFVDIQSTQRAKDSIDRFVEILFGYPYHTPTKDEYGMFMAHANALRSADLSRQVGASIITSEGSIIASGCNEVPKYGGGVYWCDGHEEDHRDFRQGFDNSAKTKIELIGEFLAALKAQGLLKDEIAAKPTAEVATALMRNNSLKDIQAANILEFGRIVHAEMAAITDAARRGIGLQSATLYSTTFPCHICARHIISSGIERVVYIEPYPKSRAGSLYDDSIVVDAPHPTEKRLRFEPFVGIPLVRIGYLK